MRIVQWYFGFHSKPPLRDLLGRKAHWQSAFGHVEAWGYNDDQTWLFLDPKAIGTSIAITHRYDAVVDLMAIRYEMCETILRIDAKPSSFRVPAFPPMNCATTCGHLVGIRAWTPMGLKRSLLAHGAEVVHG